MKEHVLELAATYFPIEIAESTIASGTEEHEQMAKKLLNVSSVFKVWVANYLVSQSAA